MIRTEELSKVFKGKVVATTALNLVNLAIDKGEFVALLGPSGSGKTTLLNILGMLDQVTSGKYWFENKEVSQLNEILRTRLRRGRVGFIFQSFNLIEELSVYQNIELPLLYMGTSSRERKEKVNVVLEKVKMLHRKKNYPLELSGGQQQKLAIARAMVTQPELILADEPTGNLDSINGEEIMDLLGQINSEGTTIVMATHSAANADKAHRIIQLLDGRIVSENIRQNLRTG